MFTRNWYSVLAKEISNGDVPYTVYTGTTYTGKPATRLNIYENSSVYAYTPTMCQLRKKTTDYGGVVLGDGTTPPTIDDYKLSGNVISGFTYTKALTITNDESGVTLSCLFTITNTSDIGFTIGELGLLASVASGSYTEATKILLERTVLDTPVSIPAGGIGQVTYTIRINHPTT